MNGFENETLSGRMTMDGGAGGRPEWTGTMSGAETQGGGGMTVLAGRYRVVRRLGEGGMGSVWLAEDLKLDGKQFAIKMLPAVLAGKKGAYRQVKAEALMAMKLAHPNIATVRAFEEDEGGNPFLVIDYIDGEPLDDILAERGPLSEEETLRILGPVAAALDYAHSQGVVHRDVKPGNVMVRKDGTPFVLDFGIAREIQETLTRVTGKLSSGTLLYMSPEQLNGDKPQPAQDVYSFAAMAYECLAGEPPFARGQIEWQIMNKTPEELPDDVGKELKKGVLAGLTKEAGARPGTCAEVLGTVQAGNSENRLADIEIRRADSEKVRNGWKKKDGGEDVFLKEVRLEKALAAAEREDATTPDEKEGLGEAKELTEAGKRAVKAGDKAAAGRLYGEAEEALDVWKARVEARRLEARARKEAELAEAERRQKAIIRPGTTKTITLPGGAKMEMSWCPAGTFMMGSFHDETECCSDELQHEVTLTRGFWMARTPVTQQQWTSVMGSNPSRFMGGLSDLFPVESVTWNDCVAFCEKTGLLLPTEAQWEYACRAGSEEAYGGTGRLDEMGWYRKNSGWLGKTHPVAQKKPNAWGLHDMHGNVWEWCADLYGAYSEDAVTDPEGAAVGNHRVLRGGSWYSSAENCRSASRGRDDPATRVNNYGFRPCLWAE